MNGTLPLSQIFVAGLAVSVPLSPVLEERLVASWEAGRAAWPEVALPAPDFVKHLAACASRGPAEDDIDGDGLIDREARSAAVIDRLVGGVNAGDLYLACACACGVPEAVAIFDQTFLCRVPAFLAHMRQTPSSLDEVRQTIRVQLLVGTNKRGPGIAAYSGRGLLVNWV